MVDHMSFDELGITNGLTQLGPVDFLTPPPAVSANEITGIAEPQPETPAISHSFKAGLGL